MKGESCDFEIFYTHNPIFNYSLCRYEYWFLKLYQCWIIKEVVGNTFHIGKVNYQLQVPFITTFQLLIRNKVPWYYLYYTENDTWLYYCTDILWGNSRFSKMLTQKKKKTDQIKCLLLYLFKYIIRKRSFFNFDYLIFKYHLVIIKLYNFMSHYANSILCEMFFLSYT